MKKIIILSFALMLIITGCGKGQTKVLPLDEIKVKAVDFINKNLVAKGNEVSMKEVVREGDLYKVVVNMANGQEVISYMSLDGMKFFPQALDVAQIEKQTAEQTAKSDASSAKEEAKVTKSKKPTVEAFVMSYCPYGTQIEKGLIPVFELLGNKIDASVKFCDYAMHGKKEIDENLIQYCMQKEEPQKYYSYIKCFLAGENLGEKCLTDNKVDKAKIDSCVKDADAKYKITEKFNDKSTWSNGQFPLFEVQKAENDKYGVQGSPTLVINGTTVSASRDSASLLKLVCSACETQPDECKKTLSSDQPAPGFGTGTSNNSTSAGCGQ